MRAAEQICIIGTPLGGARKSIVIPDLTFNWIAEGDSITEGLGGQPAWPFVALSLLPGAAQTTPNVNGPFTSPITGGGTVNLDDIATSGISALTIVQDYSTRAGASFNAAANINLLSLMIGTNTSGTSDNTINTKYTLIRDYIRNARNTGYNRVVLGTCIARDDDGGTLWNGTLSPLDVFIRANFNSDLQADFLADFGADPRFDTPLAATNLAFYTNIAPAFVHPNVAGEAAMGSIALPAVISAMQGAGTQTFAAPTWSPFGTDIFPGDGSATLSNGNRTATVPSGSATFGIRGLPGTQTAKVYWEVEVTVATAVTVGIVNDNFPFANVSFPGEDAAKNSMSYRNDGALSIGGLGDLPPGVPANLPTFATGDVIRIAMDAGNRLAWFAKSTSGVSQPWNGVASANPTTGIGGASMAGISIGGVGDRFYPAAGIFSGTDAVLSQFAASQMVFAPPAGFSTFG
jgi:hypothetical protein